MTAASSHVLACVGVCVRTRHGRAICQSDDDTAGKAKPGEKTASLDAVSLAFPEVNDVDFDSLELAEVCERLENLIAAVVDGLVKVLAR